MKGLIIAILFLTQAFHASIAAKLTDPTKPATSNNSSGTASMHKNQNLVLNAILISPHGKQAIINGKLYVEGQTILGFQLLTIGQNQVLLAGSSGSKTLFVNNSNIKKDVHNGF